MNQDIVVKQWQVPTSTCTAVKADGTPCRAVALPGRLMCWAHDPALKEKAAEARRQGGHNRSRIARARKAVPDAIGSVQGRLLKALEEVHAGTLEPRVAQAMASLAGAVVRLYEVGELETRLAEFEARLEAESRAQEGRWSA